MTNSNPKYLIKLYKYNTMFSSVETNRLEPDVKNSRDDISYKEVVLEDMPQRKEAPEESLIKDTPGENVPLE